MDKLIIQLNPHKKKMIKKAIKEERQRIKKELIDCNTCDIKNVCTYDEENPCPFLERIHKVLE